MCVHMCILCFSSFSSKVKFEFLAFYMLFLMDYIQ